MNSKSDATPDQERDNSINRSGKISSSRSSRLLATILSGWVRSAIILAIGMYATPRLLELLGKERFGVARMSEQWFLYLDLLTFGLASTFGVLLIRVATTQPSSALPGVVKYGIRCLYRQFAWIVPVGIVMILAFPFVYKLSPELRNEFYWGSTAVMVGMILGPWVVFRYALEARQTGYLVESALLAQSIVITLSAIALAYCGFGLTGQMWTTTLGAVVFSGLCIFQMGGFQRKFWAPSTPMVSSERLWGLQWPIFIASVGNQINVLSDNIVTGYLINAASVSALIVTTRLFQVCRTVAGSLNGNGMWTGLVDIRTRVGPEAFSARFAEASKLNIGINLLVLGPVLACNRRFVELWVGGDLYGGDTLTVCTMLQMSTFNAVCLYTAVIDSLGQTRKRVWFSSLGTMVKLVLLYPLVRWFGIAAIPLATALGFLACDAWFNPLILIRDYQVSSKKIVDGTLRAVGLGAFWAMTCYFIGHRSAYLMTGWIGLMAEGVTLELMGLILAWLFLLTGEERKVWKKRILGLAGR